MGCCNSKRSKYKNNYKGKNEEINLESQEKELINILAEVNKQIDNLKNQVMIILFYFIVYRH